MDLEYFFNRATVREYSSQDIDNDTLNEMIEAACHAPTTGGMQLYSVVVTRDKAMKEKLAPCHFNQPMVTTAPVVLTFCADFNRFVAWCKASYAKPGYDNFQSLVSAILDVTIFAQQFNTIAEMNELGCCYLGTTTYNAQEIANLCSSDSKIFPEIAIYYFIQYHLDRQLAAASKHARKQGVVLKGDIPIGISRNSVEAWTEPYYFNLNGQAGKKPTNSSQRNSSTS